MKKDLNWLKKEIATEITELEPNRKEKWSDVKYQTLRSVAQKIHQLDEPEVLSQEWLDDNVVHVRGLGDIFEAVAVESLLVPEKEITEKQVIDWLDNNEFYDHITAETVLERAVDKGELSYYGTKYLVIEAPIIPKYVADWVESRDYYNVYKVLQDLSAPGSPHASKDVRNWIFRNQENVEKFVRAWIDGYEVE